MSDTRAGLLRDRVLVKVKDTKLKSGLVVPTPEDPNVPQIGEVAAAGPGKFENGVHVPTEVKKGDQVMYQYSTEVTVDDKKYRLMREDDIIMIMG